jgi:hypothetical protein
MTQFFEFFILLNVNKELSQTMKNQLSFVDEDIDFILEELLTVFFEFLGHSCTEHHDLFVVRGFDENLLDVSSHVRVS